MLFPTSDQRLHRRRSGDEGKRLHAGDSRARTHLGRVDHVLTGDQAGADMERVTRARSASELVYVEMEPGDALFFHSNLLHRSDQNNPTIRAGR